MRTRILSLAARRRPPARRRHPSLEILEDRCVPAGTSIFHETDLVSDMPGVAAVTDPNLVNAWGIALSGGSPFWVSDNGTGVATIYSDPAGNNDAKFAKAGLTDALPSLDPTAGNTPTGQVANTTASDFRIVRASGVESEMELAFAALHQLCASLLDCLERLPGPQRDALAIARVTVARTRFRRCRSRRSRCWCRCGRPRREDGCDAGWAW